MLADRRGEAAAVIVAPLWQTGGSNNIFSAQVEYYKRNGLKVFFIFVDEFINSRSFEGAKYPDLGQHCSAGLNLRDIRLRYRYLISKHLFRNSKKSPLHKNYVSALALPPKHDLDLLKKVNIREICVNFAYNLDFAFNLRSAIGAYDARIVANTHDILWMLERDDKAKRLLRRAELSWVEKADVLVHVSEDDSNYFAKHTRKPNIVSYVTLRPDTEKKLTRLKRKPKRRSVLYVGTFNSVNPPSLDWFFGQAFPYIQPDTTFYFAGNICDYLKLKDSKYFSHRRQNIHLLGEVEDLASLYEQAAAIMLPTTSSTGASVKFVEALAADVPIVLTSHALRGLPDTIRKQFTPLIADDPAEFAQKLESVMEMTAAPIPTRNVYVEYFSNDAWLSRLDTRLMSKT